MREVVTAAEGAKSKKAPLGRASMIVAKAFDEVVKRSGIWRLWHIGMCGRK
jgi:hypothetical protein